MFSKFFKYLNGFPANRVCLTRWFATAHHSTQEKRYSTERGPKNSVVSCRDFSRKCVEGVSKREQLSEKIKQLILHLAIFLC